MFARGLKRKCADSDESAEGTLASLQRQSLLDMSLVKLQLCHMLVEPNLCRSVLIANTVRQIQEEMTQDGTWVTAPQVVGQAPRDRLVSTDILCRTTWEQEGELPVPDSADGHTPGLVSHLCGVESTPAPRSAQGFVWEVDRPREDRGGLQKSLDQIFETLESKAPSSVEGLFGDVDSPYYDLDAVLTGMVSGKAGPGDGLEALSSVSAPPPGSGCKSDLGELDHVVEILVET